MNPLRKVSLKVSKRYEPAAVCCLETSYRSHRWIRTGYYVSSIHKGDKSNQSIHGHSNIIKPNIQSIHKRSFSGILGSSVLSPFIKSSYLFWGIPICALLEPIINTFPFDLFFGTLLPYHACIGMQHIATGLFM